MRMPIIRLHPEIREAQDYLHLQSNEAGCVTLETYAELTQLVERLREIPAQGYGTGEVKKIRCYHIQIAIWKLIQRNTFSQTS